VTYYAAGQATSIASIYRRNYIHRWRARIYRTTTSLSTRSCIALLRTYFISLFARTRTQSLLRERDNAKKVDGGAANHIMRSALRALVHAL
jgi:hypothetical protein